MPEPALDVHPGLRVISVLGLMLGLIAHRRLHKFHLDEGDLTSDDKS